MPGPKNSYGVSKDILEIACHVKPGSNATVSVTVDDTAKSFNLTPTIDWTPASTKEGAHSLWVFLPIHHGAFVYDPATAPQWAQSVDWVLLNKQPGGPGLETESHTITISAAGNDVLICGFHASTGTIATSNFVWNPAVSNSVRENAIAPDQPCNLVIANGSSVTFNTTLSFDRQTYLQYCYADAV